MDYSKFIHAETLRGKVRKVFVWKLQNRRFERENLRAKLRISKRGLDGIYFWGFNLYTGLECLHTPLTDRRFPVFICRGRKAPVIFYFRKFIIQLIQRFFGKGEIIDQRYKKPNRKKAEIKDKGKVPGKPGENAGSKTREQVAELFLRRYFPAHGSGLPAPACWRGTG